MKYFNYIIGKNNDFRTDASYFEQGNRDTG